MFDKPTREAPIQPSNQLPTTDMATPSMAEPPSPDMGMMAPPMPSGGMDTPAGAGDVNADSAAALEIMNRNLKLIAEGNPELLQKIQDMLTPEIAGVITILFGEAVGEILMDMADDSKTTKVISKGALERIGLDKFESQLSKAEERHMGIMAPGKGAPGKAAPKPQATQA